MKQIDKAIDQLIQENEEVILRDSLVDLLRRAQQFASTILIYNGRDLQELDLYHLEAGSLMNKLHDIASKLEAKAKIE